VATRGAGIDHHVISTGRRPAGAQVIRRYLRVVDPVGAKRWWPGAADRFAVLPDQRCTVSEDDTHRILDAVDSPHGAEQLTRHGLSAHTADSARFTAQRMTLHRDRNTLVGRAEDAAEGAVDRVGEDEGARH
jgi:hypothetical protein